MEKHDLYFTLDKALRELEHRRSDKSLLNAVSSYFRTLPSPEILQNVPYAVVSRALLSPTHEINHFVKKVVPQLSIPTLFFQGPEDKFVGLNPEKRCLGKMIFSDTDDPLHFSIIEKRIIVDFKNNEGKQIKEVMTLEGEHLTSFHKKLYEGYFSSNKPLVVDYSGWFFSAEKFSDKHSYLRYLGLFVTEGILFENFLDSDEEQKNFTYNKAIPAVQELERLFGLRPLIVPMIPEENDSSPFWNYYPKGVRELFSPMNRPQ
ncbi:hypothetical protein EBR66_02930 [bacterium]|nr:hypothetical protein [bacterium]